MNAIITKNGSLVTLQLVSIRHAKIFLTKKKEGGVHAIAEVVVVVRRGMSEVKVEDVTKKVCAMKILIRIGNHFTSS